MADIKRGQKYRYGGFLQTGQSDECTIYAENPATVILKWNDDPPHHETVDRAVFIDLLLGGTFNLID